MVIKIEKTLSPEEVFTRIKQLEKKHKCNYNRLLEKNKDRKNYLIQQDIELWGKLIHAYNAYLEEGEIFFKVFDDVNISIKELRAILSPQRVELLKIIQDKNLDSISHLAKITKRNIKNIHDDLMLLKKHEFIDFEKTKKNIVPLIKVNKVLIEI